MKWPFRRSQHDEAAQASAAEAQRDRAQRTGEVLRQARVSRGLSVHDVERDIRINRSYIEALEAARFDVLPAPVYARGFMRAYARYLGLDAEEATRAIPNDLPRPAGLEPFPGLRRSAPVSLPEINPPLIIAVLIAIAIVIAAVLFVPRLYRPGTADAPLTSTAVPSASPASAAGETPDFVGMSRDAAAAALSREGFTPLIFDSPNAAPPGQVFRQAPGAGTPAKRGDVITLFVSTGPGGTATTSPTPRAAN